MKEDLWFTYKIASCSNDCNKSDNFFVVQLIIIKTRFLREKITKGL